MPASSSLRDPVEALAETFLEAHRDGLAPTIESYCEAHPELEERIASLFPVLLMMEQLKPEITAVPERIGEYRILREIGRGGMGIVYEAEQESLGRRVALKLLPESATLDPLKLERFGREAHAAARLHHTNIVPVFGVGRQDGMHFYVMQYIEGQPLDLCRPATQLSHWTANVGVQVAQALQYAHTQDTLHRDIKPANLLMDLQGTVWITDFGLAKLTDQENLTGTGDVVGTLRYMAPELFEGKADARSDIYALGMTLYELLTGRPAYAETDRRRLIWLVTQVAPPRPRKLAPEIPRDLETIVLKSIARDPAHRYQTAQELALDLQCFLEDRPIRARRVGELERIWRWCRRNRAIASLSGMALVLLVLVALAASIGYLQTQAALSRESQQRRKAVAERAKAQAERENARREQAVALAEREKARRAQQKAQAERKKAQAERRRAERTLRLALQAFEEIFAQVARRTARATGNRAESDASEPTEPRVRPIVSKDMATILLNLLKFYDQFAEQNSENPALQQEMARAHHRVGDIHQHLGQYARAEPAYERALQIYQRQGYALRTAVIHNELGRARSATGRYAEAQQSHERAKAILLGNPKHTPKPAEARYELARSDKLLGDLLHEQSKGRDAAGHYIAAMSLLERLCKQSPDNPDYRHLLALTYRNLPGFIYRAVLRLRDRVEPSRKAIRILEQLTQDFPDVPDYRLDLAETIMLQVDGIGRRRSSSKKARKQLEKALVIGRALVKRHPNVPEYQASLIRCYRQLGALLERRRETQEAEMTYRLALAGQRQLSAQFPSVPLYKLYLASTHHALGRVLLARKQFPEARQQIETAIIDQLKFVHSSPESRYGRYELARQYDSLARVLSKQKLPKLAREARDRAREVKKTLSGRERLRGRMGRGRFERGRRRR